MGGTVAVVVVDEAPFGCCVGGRVDVEAVSGNEAVAVEISAVVRMVGSTSNGGAWGNGTLNSGFRGCLRTSRPRWISALRCNSLI
uniref:Uncharacterized protein n=1 Tax=Romanomermis culicivorax TaxID=13658 RepID=A0A915L511_ROMCU